MTDIDAVCEAVVKEKNAEIEALKQQVMKLTAVFEATKTWCETCYIGKPHPRYPAYPNDEMLHAVNAVKFASKEQP